MGVSTRRQRGAAKPRAFDEDTITAKPKNKLPKKQPPSPVKTVVQKRRRLLSKAPQLSNHVLMVFVGPARELFTLHSNLLPEATQAYINQVSTGLPTFQLPSEDPDIFRIYRSWLYDKHLYTVTPGDEETDITGHVALHKDAEWLRLAHCYLLGREMKDERFANASLSSIVEKMAAMDTYPTGIATEIYEHTQIGDKLRKLIIDVHVWKGLGQWIRAPHDDAEGPFEFVRNVLNGMAEAGSEIYDEKCKAPWEEDLCGAYHWHEVSEKCKA